LRIKTILRFIMLLALFVAVLHGNGDAADKRADITATPDAAKTEEDRPAPPVDELIAEALEMSPALGALRSRVAASPPAK